MLQVFNSDNAQHIAVDGETDVFSRIRHAVNTRGIIVIPWTRVEGKNLFQSFKFGGVKTRCKFFGHDNVQCLPRVASVKPPRAPAWQSTYGR